MSDELEATIVLHREDGFRLELSLAIPPGRTAALLGPNGAGKSTAVAALAGLLRIDSGRIVLDSKVLDDPSARTFIPASERRIGVVFQGDLLFPHLTVLENISFGLRSKGLRRPEASARARAWLQRLGLEGLDQRRPAALSGGEAQRVALARALVIEPKLLLLDEPLSALDISTRTSMRRVLSRHLRDFAGPRLLITHDPTEAFLLADEIHVLENGVVTQVGSAEDIRMRPRTRYIADLAGANLWAGIAERGRVTIGEHSLQIAESDLEGEVLLVIRPTAIAIHLEEPGGSARNAWPTQVELIEPMGERVRLLTGPPLSLTAEITAAALASLELRVGARIWVSIKATEIEAQAETRMPV
jgi:molybdate transport system ATP-binding protein